MLNNSVDIINLGFNAYSDDDYETLHILQWDESALELMVGMLTANKLVVYFMGRTRYYTSMHYNYNNVGEIDEIILLGGLLKWEI